MPSGWDLKGYPLFPLAPDSRSPLSAGFKGGYYSRYFSWPLWEPPASLFSVKALLRMEELHDPSPAMVPLKQRGVSAVYRSKREPIGDKGYAVLKSADLVG